MYGYFLYILHCMDFSVNFRWWGEGGMVTAAGPSCGPSAQGVKPPSVLRPGCCCYMQEIAPVDYWHQAHSSFLGGPRHFGTGLTTANTWIWFHLVRELNALHLCRNIRVYSCCLSTSAYKTFCEVMEMKEVKIAGVQHWHLSTELWTGSWTNNQEKQVSFDGQSCQHRLLVKRVNKERDREREEMTYSNCAERQILICLFSDSFQLLFSGQSGGVTDLVLEWFTKLFYKSWNGFV